MVGIDDMNLRGLAWQCRHIFRWFVRCGRDLRGLVKSNFNCESTINDVTAFGFGLYGNISLTPPLDLESLESIRDINGRRQRDSQVVIPSSNTRERESNYFSREETQKVSFCG
jgi:hypothetical protein